MKNILPTDPRAGSFPKSHVSCHKPRAADTEQEEPTRQMMPAKNKGKKEQGKIIEIICVFMVRY